MRVYLEDDIASALLFRFLRRSGHDVQGPADVGLDGSLDPVHLMHAIREARILLSRNYRDFELLHLLILQAQGHHPGILMVRRDNDPRRNLNPQGIVRALTNLIAAGVPVTDQYIVLNHWR
jgi:hypothetical protein